MNANFFLLGFVAVVVTVTLVLKIIIFLHFTGRLDRLQEELRTVRRYNREIVKEAGDVKNIIPAVRETRAAIPEIRDRLEEIKSSTQQDKFPTPSSVGPNRDTKIEIGE